jgi:hypothetical protein
MQEVVETLDRCGPSWIAGPEDSIAFDASGVESGDFVPAHHPACHIAFVIPAMREADNLVQFVGRGAHAEPPT